jgi:hypothetical protein
MLISVGTQSVGHFPFSRRPTITVKNLKSRRKLLVCLGLLWRTFHKRDWQMALPLLAFKQFGICSLDGVNFREIDKYLKTK